MTSIAAKLPLFGSLDDEKKRFLNWMLIWVVLANIGFMTFWFIGAPPRLHEIMVFGFVGLIVKRFNYWLQVTGFVLAMAWSVLAFISGLFNLSMQSLIYSLQFFVEIKPTNSSEYIMVGAAVMVLMGIAIRLLRRDTNFSASPLLLTAGFSFIALAATDYQMGKGMRGHYKRSAPDGAAFGSATQDTNFIARANGKRNLMIVIVESLGVPNNNKEMNRLLFASYKNSPEIRARYDISQGTNPYFVSTTAGEVRELCGRWGDYYDLLDRKDDGCLPAKLTRKGYNTRAVHSFTGEFFERSTWYPNIGFQTQEFGDTLRKNGARHCGGVFAGACDRDVPRQLAAYLKAQKKPTFLYWLTVNTHLPMPQGQNLDNEHCEKLSPYLAEEFPQICRQFMAWTDVDKAMVREITAKDFPATDILIVGDHMPPYYDRHHRSQFDPEHVPWLYLKSKD